MNNISHVALVVAMNAIEATGNGEQAPGNSSNDYVAKTGIGLVDMLTM